MKPFDLEKAKAGAKVCTRDGRDARIICFDRNDNSGFHIVALVTKSDIGEECNTYTQNGKHIGEKWISQSDLMMATEKKVGWINLYRSNNAHILSNCIYSNERDARESAMLGVDYEYYIQTIKIEWEE